MILNKDVIELHQTWGNPVTDSHTYYIPKSRVLSVEESKLQGYNTPRTVIRLEGGDQLFVDENVVAVLAALGWVEP